MPTSFKFFIYLLWWVGGGLRHRVCGGQRAAPGTCFSPATWDLSQPSGLASSVLPFETTCEPLLPLFAGSLVHIPRPPKLPTLPANTCRCVGFFNQHLNGHFLLPIAHHGGWCCPTVLEVKSLECASWDPTSGHSSELMCLSLSTIPGPRWSLMMAVVTCPGLYGASTHLLSCIFLPTSPAAWVLIRVKVTPYLNPSWIPLCSYKHDPSLFSNPPALAS